MNIILVLLFSLSMTSAFAETQDCTYSYNPEGSTLGWTAFKTPKKVGVSGRFSDFKIKAKDGAESVEKLLSSANFEINSQKIDSGDKARDAKIAQFFFKKMLKGTKISGKVLKINKNTAQVELMMNGAKKMVEMNSKFDSTTSILTLEGTMDVLEFGMKKNLATLTKACFEKHEGVTWPDVEFKLVSKIKKNCK